MPNERKRKVSDYAVPSSRAQIVKQLENAGFVLPAAMEEYQLALLGAIAGVRSDLQEIADKIDDVWAAIDYAFANWDEGEDK